MADQPRRGAVLVVGGVEPPGGDVLDADARRVAALGVIGGVAVVHHLHDLTVAADDVVGAARPRLRALLLHAPAADPLGQAHLEPADGAVGRAAVGDVDDQAFDDRVVGPSGLVVRGVRGDESRGAVVVRGVREAAADALGRGQLVLRDRSVDLVRLRVVGGRWCSRRVVAGRPVARSAAGHPGVGGDRASVDADVLHGAVPEGRVEPVVVGQGLGLDRGCCEGGA